MAPIIEVPFREPVFHVLWAAARPRLKLPAEPLPLNADFPHEAVDDSLGPFRHSPRRRRPATERFPARLARTRVGVCGSVRIPPPPAATRTSRPSRNSSPAAPSLRPMPDRFSIRLSRTRDAVCGFVRIQDGPHPSRKDTRP